MPLSNERSGSTHWKWIRVKITRPPQAPSKTGSEATSTLHLRPWNRRDPLTIQVVYRGGPEAWYLIKSRGGVIRVPGHEALHDVMERIYEGYIWMQ